MEDGRYDGVDEGPGVWRSIAAGVGTGVWPAGRLRARTAGCWGGGGGGVGGGVGGGGGGVGGGGWGRGVYMSLSGATDSGNAQWRVAGRRSIGRFIQRCKRSATAGGGRKSQSRFCRINHF